MLMLDQLESNPPRVVPLRASVQQWKTRQASSIHKGCLDRQFGHTPPKPKLDIGRLDPFRKRMNRPA